MNALLTMLLGMASFLVVPTGCLADHVLGLPRYQAGQESGTLLLEYPARSGPFEIMLTCPLPAKSGTARLVFYIRDGTSGQPYGGPVAVRMVKRSVLWADAEVLPRTRLEAQEGLFRQEVMFPEEASYVAELELDVGGNTERIPFLIVVGGRGRPLVVVAGLGGVLAAFVLVMLWLKRSRANG